eukprot:GHVN01016406.1.p1 GENE.GHVN01016406.1~~GHVN01016406.1.p1  ORF type:complete len:103 (-),score=0.82 GHVN01016406.1:73-381(-)
MSCWAHFSHLRMSSWLGEDCLGKGQRSRLRLGKAPNFDFLFRGAFRTLPSSSAVHGVRWAVVRCLAGWDLAMSFSANAVTSSGSISVSVVFDSSWLQSPCTM